MIRPICSRGSRNFATKASAEAIVCRHAEKARNGQGPFRKDMSYEFRNMAHTRPLCLVTLFVGQASITIKSGTSPKGSLALHVIMSPLGSNMSLYMVAARNIHHGLQDLARSLMKYCSLNSKTPKPSRNSTDGMLRYVNVWVSRVGTGAGCETRASCRLCHAVRPRRCRTMCQMTPTHYQKKTKATRTGSSYPCHHSPAEGIHVPLIIACFQGFLLLSSILTPLGPRGRSAANVLQLARVRGPRAIFAW